MKLLIEAQAAPPDRPPHSGDRPQFRIQRPFVSVWVAASVLDCSEHRIAGWIDDGSLPFAFNIARPGVRRACVRLSTAGIQGRLDGRPPFAGLPEFLDAVFPAQLAAYKPPKLAWMMQCDADHIYTLIRARALADVGPRSYEISRESLLGFLSKRNLT